MDDAIALRDEERRMRAAIYHGKRDARVEELPDPLCGPRDVIVRNIFSSVCGTDAAVFAHGPGTGHRVEVGGEFGHEAVSRIVEVGAEVTDFAVGDRVYPYPLLARGDASRAGTMGAFSELMLIPGARESRELYRVPDEIPDGIACLIEPFTVGCRAARRSQPRAGEAAIVYGAGTIGIAAALALHWFGLERVLICERSALRAERARALGLEVAGPEVADPYAYAMRAFGSAPSIAGPTADVDIFIDAAGAETILDDFVARAKIGSRFVEVAVNKATRGLDLLALTYGQKSIIGSGGYFPEDVRDVMDLMASRRWDIAGIVTHEFGLEDIEEALRIAGDPEASLNVRIRMESPR